MISAVLDGGVDVAVGIIAQVVPDRRPARVLEGHGAFGLGGVEQEGDHRVLRNVFGDVLLGVVGTHLLLVGVFLEDVAEHLRVNLIAIAQRAVVEVPLVGIEESEDLLEGTVRDLDVRVGALDGMLGEDAALEILQTTLNEEGAVDKKLTELAMSVVNVRANEGVDSVA